MFKNHTSGVEGIFNNRRDKKKKRLLKSYRIDKQLIIILIKFILDQALYKIDENWAELIQVS